MRDKAFYRKLISVALPIALQNLMLALVAAADAFMLGRLEQNAMSAVSLATQIQFVQNMILSSVTGAVAILGAQYFGKGDPKTVGDIFHLGLRLCGITSVLFAVGCIVFPRALMLVFTNEEKLIAIGVGYLQIAGWSYLLTGISQCYLAVMKITGHTAMVARISMVTVLLNIVLNAVFIFGLLGAPAMGARGAALATLIARIAELAWCVYASYQEGYMRPHAGGFFRIGVVLRGDFMRCMMPILGASLLWGTGFTSYSAFMGHLGLAATAANSVAAVIRDLVCCMCNGLASGGGIIVGNEFGAGQLERGKRYGITLAKLAFLFGFASTVIVLASIPLALSFVKLTPEAGRLLIGMMVILSVYMIGRVVNTVIINGVFYSGGDTMFDIYSLIVTMWGIAVPLAVLGTFVFHWPVLVVYACTCLDEVGKIPWVLHHFRRYKWVKDLTR